MKKFLLLWVLASILAIPAAAQDSIQIITPMKGIIDGFKLERFRKNIDIGKEIVWVSTTSSSQGFSALDTQARIANPSLGTIFTDTINSGLPPSPQQLWVKVLFISKNLDSLWSNIGTVTTLVAPKTPKISFADFYNQNGKVFSKLTLESNVDAKLYAFTAFSTPSTAIARKVWSISAGTTSFIDSSYFSGTTDVYVKYALVNSADSITTAWEFVRNDSKPSTPITVIKRFNSNVSGYEVTLKCDFQLPNGMTSPYIVIDYAKDSLFNTPENWKVFDPVTDTTVSATFTGLNPGRYYGRVVLKDNMIDTFYYVKTLLFDIYTLSVDNNRLISKVPSQWIGQEIALYNLAGQKVKTGMIDSNSIEIDLSDLPPGIYISRGPFGSQKILR